MSEALAEEPASEATAEQLAAIEARDRDVFCEAAAGTGKTRVLVERYCEAVERDEIAVEAILAFTFTERAAAELRERVRRALTVRAARAQREGEPALADRLRRAGRETERAWVTTIHGFCRRLLATHPAAAGIDPRFRVLDEGEASRLRARARDDAVAQVAAAAPESIETIAAYRPQRLGAMAVAAHERLRSQGMLEPRLPAVGAPVRSEASSEERALAPAEREQALAAHDALERLLAAFGTRYEELKASRSALDFADLELRALQLLRDSPAVAQAWRDRFSHIMVDEFQDTNGVQLELVEALRGPSTRVFRVGDELQSIYRFRNADLEVFREQRRLAVDDPDTALAPLTGNFRSRPEVLAAVNALGEAVVGEGYRPLAATRPAGGPEPELLLVLDEGRAAGARGWTELADALDPPPAMRQPGVVAEARVLAARLRALVDEGRAQAGEMVVLLRAFTHVDAFEEALDRAGLSPYVVGGRGYWSQQQVEDLLRLLECVANPLDDEMLLGALACPANGISPDALWMLRRATLADRDDDERRAPDHLWRAVAWGFGGSERAPTAVDEAWLERIGADDARRLTRFCEILHRLRAAAPVLALDELAWRTMEEFEYDLHLLARPQGPGRMANVRKLMRLAREYEEHDGRDLRGFLVSARELTERDEREGIAATQAEEHDGVRIMTVHAAKGLEFSVVAVPELGRPLVGGERTGDVIVGRAGPARNGRPDARFGMRVARPAAGTLAVWELNELAEEAKHEAAAEGARLAHVAATRARDQLLLSGVFRPADASAAEPGVRDSALRRLLPALAARGWDVDGPAVQEVELDPVRAADGIAGDAALLRVAVTAPDAELAARLAERLPPPPRAAVAPSAAEAPLRRPASVLPVGHLSYTALADHERCGYRFYVERMLDLGAPPQRLHPDATADPDAEAAPSARDRRLGFGNAVHAILERCARTGWQRPDDDQLSELLAREGLEGERELERARAMVDGWLESSLLAELRGGHTRAEVPFALGLGGAVVRGQIDLLVTAPSVPDPPGGPRQLDLLAQEGDARGVLATVVDYKTDALGDAGAGALRERYRSQRELYALAVASAGGDAAIRAVHVYLEAPDEPLVDVFEPASLKGARAALERRVERIRAGEGLRPAPEPDRSLCAGCPAAARLCPHPAWRPGR